MCVCECGSEGYNQRSETDAIFAVLHSNPFKSRTNGDAGVINLLFFVNGRAGALNDDHKWQTNKKRRICLRQVVEKTICNDLSRQ